jgi:hypothetical protein
VKKIDPQMTLMKKKKDFFLVCVICSATSERFVCESLIARPLGRSNPGRRGTGSHAALDRHVTRPRAMHDARARSFQVDFNLKRESPSTNKRNTSPGNHPAMSTFPRAS